ncbi:MAG: hypothetical protein MI921_23075 [Cytophagales bacterium]|nr:hypothetical protein [Cytophagales bacterium]
MKIAKIGLDDSYPEYIQQKIILSNQIALVIGLLVAAPFTFISLIHFPDCLFTHDRNNRMHVYIGI